MLELLLRRMDNMSVHQSVLRQMAALHGHLKSPTPVVG